MSPLEIKQRIESLAPQTEAWVRDMTGTQDHYEAVVISPVFGGKAMIENHRTVLDLFKSEIDSGEVHALTLKTYSPEQAKKLGIL